MSAVRLPKASDLGLQEVVHGIVERVATAFQQHGMGRAADQGKTLLLRRSQTVEDIAALFRCRFMVSFADHDLCRAGDT